MPMFPELAAASGPTDNLFGQLFIAANYCFATEDAGRTPTFYFAQGGLECLNTATLCGRVRTMHPKGPLIDVTTDTKQHMFFDDKNAQLAASRVLKDWQVTQTPADLEHLVGQTRTYPFDGAHHLEFTRRTGAHGKPFSRRHPSGGTIVMAPRITTDAMARGLVSRVFHGPCKVRRNTHDVFHREGPTLGGGLNVAAYLRSLP